MDCLKTCPLCGVSFSIDDLLHDRRIAPLGMRVEDDDSRLNFMFFTHDIPECGTTFVVPVEAFREVLPEQAPPEIRTGSEFCEGRCRDLADRGLCRQDCRWAPYRRLLSRMINERRAPSTTPPVSFEV